MKIGKAQVVLSPMGNEPDFPRYYRRNLHLLGYRWRLYCTFDCSRWPHLPQLNKTVLVEPVITVDLPIAGGRGRIDRPATFARAQAAYKATGLSSLQDIDKAILSNFGSYEFWVPQELLAQSFGPEASVRVVYWVGFVPYVVRLKGTAKGRGPALFALSLPCTATFVVFVTGYCQPPDDGIAKTRFRQYRDDDEDFGEIFRYKYRLHQSRRTSPGPADPLAKSNGAFRRRWYELVQANKPPWISK